VPGLQPWHHILKIIMFKKYYTEKELQIIQNTKIGIAGAGGIGSNIANILVRSGFKNFEILDHDIVEISNLNRQQYFLNDIGKHKVDALEENLKKINPEIIVKKHKIELTRKNAKDFFQNANILFEAFDNIKSKKIMLEEFGNTETTLISCNGMAGISNKTEIKIRKINDKLYLVGDEISCISKAPPFAPRVTACAALMASIAFENTLIPT
jgi:sulfur carrier protein ThiS adenylyltransferase